MVNSDGQITKPATSITDVVKSKKKRPRIRVRSRNKAVRLSKLNGEEKPAETLTIPPSQPEKVQPNSAASDCLENESSKTATMPVEPAILQAEEATMQNSANAAPAANAVAVKTREEIMAEREAKKLAKQAKKLKTAATETPSAATAQPTAAITANITSDAPNLGEAASAMCATPSIEQTNVATNAEKTREQIKAEREAKKLAKQAAKATKTVTPANTNLESTTNKLEELNITAANQPKKKPELTKAERRAIQEAQRAAKAQKIAAVEATKTVAPAKPAAKPEAVVAKTKSSPIKVSFDLKPRDCRVRLFNHLKCHKKDASLFVNNAHIHPSIMRLGEQYAKRTIVGSNARCIAFLNALKMVIHDFETPPKKEFARSLEAHIKTCVDHLQHCRPLAVSVCNVYKHINNVLRQLPADQPESDLKQNLCHFIETYIENQIGKAAQAISSSLQEKIIDGDVLLTFGCSSLINFICEEAQKRCVDFRVIIADSRPFYEGQEMLRRLSAKGIPCTYVLINALGFVMPEATKVLLGAHALLSNGYVMARTGTAQVALVARSFNVPVLVCCETHKFSERFQTDAIVYNELGNPDDLIINDNNSSLANWEAKGKLSPLNLNYDITPPELVTAVVTEVSILPCTSVPVILRIKPTEIGYYC